MNLTENAGFADAPIRGNYKIRERLLTKKRIYEMILKGYTYAAIMQELELSERSFYRYLNIIFRQEDNFLDDTLSFEELRRQAILARDRLLSNIRRIEQWLEDEPNSKDRTDLLNLHSELCAAVLRLYDKGPSRMTRSLPPSSYEGDEEGE
jgi:hypothetical protein